MPLLNMGEALAVNARLYPEKPGARDRSRSMTFRQWDERARRLANALVGLGLEKGDRVAILAHNAVEWMDLRGHRHGRARDGAHQLSPGRRRNPLYRRGQRGQGSHR